MTYFLLYTVAILLIKICVTGIFDKKVAHPKVYWAELNSMHQNVSKLASFLKIDLPFLILTNLSFTLSPMTLLIINTSWIMNGAPFIIIMIDRYSILAIGGSPFRSFRLRSYFPINFFYLISATKRIRFQPQNCSLARSFLSNPNSLSMAQSRLCVSFDDAHRYM